jgi:hypothetical protein
LKVIYSLHAKTSILSFKKIRSLRSYLPDK